MGYILRSTDIEPPGGWVYDDPDLPGLPVRARDFVELLDRAVHLRKVNNLSIYRMEYRILSAIAETLNTAQKTRFAVQETQLPRSFRQRLTALRALVHPDYVLPERAEERARICARCPKQVKNTDPVTQVEDAAAVSKVHSDGRRVSNEAELFNCGVCTCPNKASVHFDVEQAVAGLTTDQWAEMPDDCWKKAELYGLQPGSKEAIAAKKALKACNTCRKPKI